MFFLRRFWRTEGEVRFLREDFETDLCLER